MAYSRDAFTRDQQETRERQDQRETREKLERYGAMGDSLTQSNKIAGENQRQLERGREIVEIARESQRELDRRYELTELFPKSLLRLKKW